MPDPEVPRARAHPPDGPRAGAPMSLDGERTYDSFVVRLWREPVSGRVLRAEVEHVQGRAVATAAGVDPAWILAAIRRCLDAQPPDDGAAPID